MSFPELDHRAATIFGDLAAKRQVTEALIRKQTDLLEDIQGTGIKTVTHLRKVGAPLFIPNLTEDLVTTVGQYYPGKNISADCTSFSWIPNPSKTRTYNEMTKDPNGSWTDWPSEVRGIYGWSIKFNGLSPQFETYLRQPESREELENIRPSPFDFTIMLFQTGNDHMSTPTKLVVLPSSTDMVSEDKRSVRGIGQALLAEGNKLRIQALQEKSKIVIDSKLSEVDKERLSRERAYAKDVLEFIDSFCTPRKGVSGGKNKGLVYVKLNPDGFSVLRLLDLFERGNYKRLDEVLGKSSTATDLLETASNEHTYTSSTDAQLVLANFADGVPGVIKPRPLARNKVIIPEIPAGPINARSYETGLDSSSDYTVASAARQHIANEIERLIGPLLPAS